MSCQIPLVIAVQGYGVWQIVRCGMAIHLGFTCSETSDDVEQRRGVARPAGHWSRLPRQHVHNPMVPHMQGALAAVDPSATPQQVASTLANMERQGAQQAGAQAAGSRQQDQQQQAGGALLEDLVPLPEQHFEQLNIHDPRRYFQNMGGVAAGPTASASSMTAYDSIEALEQVAVRPGQPVSLDLQPDVMEQVGGWPGAACVCPGGVCVCGGGGVPEGEPPHCVHAFGDVFVSETVGLSPSLSSGARVLAYHTTFM